MTNNRIQAYYQIKKFSKDFALGKMENLIPQYLRSGIEIFSHQIYASTYALSNPFVKGFILGDEAGLGKTMEALLILSQYINQKSKCLVVVPQPTIEDWLTDIIRVFNFRCVVLDNIEREKNLNFGVDFKDYTDGILLTTYDYLLANAEKFKEYDWQLCILDEAHRFRNYKIKENKTADIVLSIVPNAYKILLTATPIQKNEDDIFGLINFIDENIFTDYDEFHKRYFRKPENYPELRDIIAPYIFRTLRNQVRLETKLTDRQILTQIYQMTDKEKQLYSLIEKYVAKPKRFAFPEMDPYELNLMLNGTLSSSAYALSKTLSGIYTRLLKSGNADCFTEAEEIKQMLNLATSIPFNTKDELLLKAIEKTFSMFYKKGIAKKCVIFTGNTQTQEHIAKLLMEHTEYSINSFNGTTTDEPLKKFLRSEKPAVLISTDKGNESLNWQVSAFVINYDFPQVLLDMEQRISRCHRIGQQTDVFVLNFICPQNFYDVRMYELFYKRINISSSIVGASDSIISGAIDGDIEQNVIDTLNGVRKKKEVQLDFSSISNEIKEELDSIKATSNDMLFNTFDKNILERTKNMAEIIKRKVVELKTLLNELARYYYKDNFVEENIFECKTSWHDKNPYARPARFSLIPRDDCREFTFGQEPCDKMLFSLQSTYDLKPHKLQLKNNGSIKSKSGYIGCFDLQMMYGYHSVSKTFYVGLDENGNFLSNEDCEKILDCDCLESEIISIDDEIKNKLTQKFEEHIPALSSPLKEEIDKSANLPISHIKMQGEEEKQKLAKEIEDLQRQINALKNTVANDNFAEKFAKNQKISELTDTLYQLKDDEFIKKSKINKAVKQKIDELYSKFELKTSNYLRFMIYYEVK